VAKERVVLIAETLDRGRFDPRKIAATLMTTAEDLARSAGLGRDAIGRTVRIDQPRTQRRLREVVEILSKAEPRFGSALGAYAWYRAQPLPGFAGQTAMQLVQEGNASEVLEYLDAVDAGIFA
jgi:uncharacterized protein (DUF2384 family)